MKSQNFTVAIALAVAATIAFAAIGSASLAHYASAQSAGNSTNTTSNQTSTSGNSTNTAPTIKITSPVNDSTVSSRSFSVNGTASGTELANVTVSVDGGAAALAKGTDNWTFAASVIADGKHNIVATVMDKSGKTSNDTISVNVMTPAPASNNTQSNATSTASTTTAAPASGSSIVQQGTIASNSTGFATILAPTDSVYTGTISYAAGSSAELYVLHAYGISSSQNVSSQFSA
ncbi:MAG: hypothetical protein ABI361_04390, partial [Nitrososphaera sp.]